MVLFQSLGVISSNRSKNPRQGHFMVSRLCMSRHRRDRNQGIASLKHARLRKIMPNIIDYRPHLMLEADRTKILQEEALTALEMQGDGLSLVDGHHCPSCKVGPKVPTER
jgi:hypothetical protein